MSLQDRLTEKFGEPVKVIDTADSSDPLNFLVAVGFRQTLQKFEADTPNLEQEIIAWIEQVKTP